jgi:hypothetical protein
VQSRGGYCGYGTNPYYSGGPVPGVPIPDGALISDDDDSFISIDTESEGDFGLNHP